MVRLTRYVELLHELPVPNNATLFLLLRLLVKIASNAEKTLMPPNNLGTIFGPIICRRKDSDIAQELIDIPSVSKLCIELIQRFEELFDYRLSSQTTGEVGYADSSRTKKNSRRKWQLAGKERHFALPSNAVAASPSAASSSHVSPVASAVGEDKDQFDDSDSGSDHESPKEVTFGACSLYEIPGMDTA